ncbi:MAG: hypothetical protein GY742_18610 [Hyphomicrobiales bacterium]|nr:hypothetical protein [Hyphomicrobiales bacterium]
MRTLKSALLLTMAATTALAILAISAAHAGEGDSKLSSLGKTHQIVVQANE